jgi:hypothetical protein
MGRRTTGNTHDGLWGRLSFIIPTINFKFTMFYALLIYKYILDFDAFLVVCKIHFCFNILFIFFVSIRIWK